MSKYKFVETKGMKEAKRNNLKFSQCHTLEETKKEIDKWLKAMFKTNKVNIDDFGVEFRPNPNKISICWKEKRIIYDTIFK